MEVWKKFKESKKYYWEVSSFGRVRRSDGIIIKFSITPKGYIHNKRYGYLHRIVAEKFVKNPKNKPQVNHKNGNKSDNTFKNLEWVTNGENQNHAIKSGLRSVKLNFSDISKILDLRSKGLSYQKIAQNFSVHSSTIRRVLIKYNYANS